MNKRFLENQINRTTALKNNGGKVHSNLAAFTFLQNVDHSSARVDKIESELQVLDSLRLLLKFISSGLFIKAVQ